MLSRFFASSLAALLTLLLIQARPLAAPAAGEGKPEDAEAVAKVQKLNRAAMQYFDDLNYAMAEKSLLEALAIVEKSNLASGPAALSTNGNLAVLYSQGLRNPDKAVAHFKKALAIKSDLKLSKQRNSAETEANLARAKAEMAGAPPVAASAAGAKAAAPAGALSTSADLICSPPAAAPIGEDVALTCQTTGNLKAAAVMMYYKANAGEVYLVLSMTKTAGAGGSATWAATIPGGHTQADWIPVYFEVRDEAGATLATFATEDNPHAITVKGAEGSASAPAGGPPPVGEEGEEDEEEEEGEEIDDSNPLARLEDERWREHEGSKGTWWFSLSVGIGIGYAPSGSTEAFGKPPYYCAVNSGLAWATTGHLAPEIGYFIGRKTALSLAARDQGIFGGVAGTATGAHTLLLRMLFFTEGDEKIRWYFALAGGWGEGFRLQVKADVRDSEGYPTGMTVKDTVRGGPFVAGAGGGVLYKLSRHWRWSLETQWLLGFGHLSAVADFTTGARYQF
jgi:hypothetical protein